MYQPINQSNGRRSGQSVTASDFGSNGPRFESGRGRCVESLDKALYFHCSQGEAFTLASISYLAILGLVKRYTGKKKKKAAWEMSFVCHSRAGQKACGMPALRAVRFAAGSGYQDNVAPLVKQLKIVSLEHRWALQVAEIVFRCNHGSAPSALKDKLRPNNHGARTRGSKESYLPYRPSHLFQTVLPWCGTLFRVPCNKSLHVHPSKNFIWSAKLNEPLSDLCFAICRFSQVRFITPSHLTHNLFFLFPIVFWY